MIAAICGCVDPAGMIGRVGGLGCSVKVIPPEIITYFDGLVTSPMHPKFPPPKLLCIDAAFSIVSFSILLIDFCDGSPCIRAMC